MRWPEIIFVMEEQHSFFARDPGPRFMMAESIMDSMDHRMGVAMGNGTFHFLDHLAVIKLAGPN